MTNVFEVGALNNNLEMKLISDWEIDKIINCFMVFATIIVLVLKIQFKVNIGKDFFILLQTLRRFNQ